MAVAKDDIRLQFFPKQKRRLELDRWAPKRNNENEKRVLVEFIMPLTGQPLRGFPDFLQEAFHLFENEGGPARTLDLSTEMEGMTMEFFDTPTSGRMQILVAATLRAFELIRVPDGDKFLTALKFNTTVPRSIAILKWLHSFEGMTMWAEFDPQEIQMKIVDDKAPAQPQLIDDDDEDGDGKKKKGRTQ